MKETEECKNMRELFDVKDMVKGMVIRVDK
jgi:hypothetical protein